jgi:hypothetical protein
MFGLSPQHLSLDCHFFDSSSLFHLHPLSLSPSSASVVRAVMSSVTGQRWQRCIGFLQSLIHDPPISDRELCLLTPFQQWRKYKHFPLVIILHFLVVLFITIQVPWHSWPST